MTYSMLEMPRDRYDTYLAIATLGPGVVRNLYNAVAHLDQWEVRCIREWEVELRTNRNEEIWIGLDTSDWLLPAPQLADLIRERINQMRRYLKGAAHEE